MDNLWAVLRDKWMAEQKVEKLARLVYNLVDLLDELVVLKDISKANKMVDNLADLMVDM